MFANETSKIDFRNNIKKAITLLTNSSDALSDNGFLELMFANDIPYAEAVEILVFLPVACVRQWLPGVKWQVYYRENGKAGKFKYADTESYVIIFDETTKFIQSAPGVDNILKIAGRSSEFHVLNTLFLQNPNLNVEDIELAEAVVMGRSFQ